MLSVEGFYSKPPSGTIDLQGVWVDDAGAGGVSFKCANGYDLDAGADIHYTSVDIYSIKNVLDFSPVIHSEV